MRDEQFRRTFLAQKRRPPGGPCFRPAFWAWNRGLEGAVAILRWVCGAPVFQCGERGCARRCGRPRPVGLSPWSGPMAQHSAACARWGARRRRSGLPRACHHGALFGNTGCGKGVAPRPRRGAPGPRCNAASARSALGDGAMVRRVRLRGVGRAWAGAAPCGDARVCSSALGRPGHRPLLLSDLVCASFGRGVGP